MKIKKLILIFALVLTLAVSVMTLRAQLSTVSINNMHQCKEETVYYTETEPVYDYVTYERPTYGLIWVEKNQTNEIGVNGKEEYKVLIKTGTKEVQKSRKICIEDTSQLTINSGFKTLPIDYGNQNFYCSNTESQIICDSKDDGNGDGICQSGESCAVFEIGEMIKLTYTNGNNQLICFKREIKGIPFEVCTDTTVNIRDLLEVD